MPIYEFRCQKCGKVKELLLPTSESDSVQVCPGKRCNGIMNRIVSKLGYFKTKIDYSKSRFTKNLGG